jgi:hypothetical protein
MLRYSNARPDRRALPERGVGTMWTSTGQGEGSPVTFYERYGFERTGDFHGNETLLRLEIS